MAAIQSRHHSDNDKLCAKCGDALAAPEWSQYMDEQRVFNLWSCTKCGSCFGEVSVSLPAEAESIEDSKKKDVFPSRWVA